MSDGYDLMDEIAEVLEGSEPLPTKSSNSAEHFKTRLENVDGTSEYLVLLHHQDIGLLEIFGNVTDRNVTIRMMIEALHMISEQWIGGEERRYDDKAEYTG